MTVTTGLDASQRPVRESLDVHERIAVLSTTSFELRFDRFLLPTTVVRQSVCLRSATAPVPTYDACIGGVFLEPSYDPVRRSATFRQTAGDRLAPGTEYQLTVLAPPDETKTGFRAFDGAPLAESIEYRIVVTAEDPPGAGDETPLGGDLFCCFAECDPADPTCTPCPMPGDGAGQNFKGCAYSSCHAEGKTPEGPLGAAMGLNLSPPGTTDQPYADPILATAILHVAHQTETGERADDPSNVNGLRFGRAMPIVAPGNPGQSYLLYKLMVNPENYPPGEAPSSEEIARLRASVVVGMPMPVGFPLTGDGLELISAWIAAGASTKICP